MDSEPKTLYVTAKFSNDFTIDIPLPAFEELLEIKKMNDLHSNTSLVHEQIDKTISQQLERKLGRMLMGHIGMLLINSLIS
ncbi:12321_t:CDS:2 [Ambispora leptoticha]|uniref:12321_t:CDS:1 n=1 Tax=Ambispora leptoticha TaxID=144679 RepID=A0A9N9A4V2_9GLOM|nr:12321_t:CDS:2 [Ambispora leptoticha]